MALVESQPVRRSFKLGVGHSQHGVLITSLSCQWNFLSHGEVEITRRQPADHDDCGQLERGETQSPRQRTWALLVSFTAIIIRLRRFGHDFVRGLGMSDITPLLGMKSD